ncbi:MAG TPA: reverse transcriptase-like protein [Actinomycetales bacterium]|nr:reverse transcriptase-like protein [Actinomycetales bacterium]
MSARRLIVEADGGSRGNPGPAGYGALVRDAATGEVLYEIGESIGTATNNVAEYRGLIAGLRAAADIDPAASVEARLDSKLLVEQMTGRWKIKHEDMRRLALEAKKILPPSQVTYTWVPRAENAEADRLANEAMDAAARGEEWRLTERPARASEGGHEAEAGPAGPVQPSPADGYAGDLTPKDAYRLLEQEPTAMLVDCRTRPEWSFVGVPDLSALGKRPVLLEWQRYPDGAQNPHFTEHLREQLRQVGDDAPLVFICRSGGRSVAAARAATEAGLGPAYNVLGGFEGPVDEHGHRGSAGWRAEGLPWHQS